MKKFSLLLVALALLVAVLGCPVNSSHPLNGTTPGISKGTNIGNQALDFQLEDLNGQTISLSDLRGRPIILNFWATWCGPCRAEMPYLQQVYDQWQEQGLVLLAVNLKENSSQVNQFMQSNGYSFSVLFDNSGSVGNQYDIQAIPTTFFIDTDGIIQDWKVGSFPSKAAIETSLSKIIS
jgi:peroxiredoxin